MAFTAAELTKDGNLKIAGNLNTRLPVVTDGLIAHFPFDGSVQKYIPNQIRYIRDSTNGSSANTSNHWVEIQAIDLSGINVALNKTGTSSTGSWNTLLTDGATASSPYWGFGSGITWVQIDLGSLYSLSKIIIWHYYADSRTYRNTKTEVSEDGINWISIFDSIIEGEYVETGSGHTIDLNNIGTTCLPISNVNNILTTDGVWIGDATTNLSPFDAFFNNSNGIHIGDPAISNGTTTIFGGGWRAATHYNNAICKVEYTTTPYGWGKVLRWIHRDVNGWKGIMSTSSFTAIANKTYTISVWVRLSSGISGSPSAYAFYGPTGYQYNIVWEKTPSLYPGEWIRGTCTFTPDINVSGTVYLYGLDSGNDIIMDYWGFQIEEKAYATYPVLSTNGISSLKLAPLLFPQVSGTIHCIAKGNKISACKVFSNEDGSGGNSIILNPNGSVVFNSGGSTISTTISNIHDWHTYTYRIDSDSKVSCFVDGVYIGKTTITIYANRANFQLGKDTNGTYLTSTNIKDLSIYNRVLSNDEIKQLSSSSFELKANGNLISSQVITKPNIPNDIYYLPLEINCKDQYNVILPSNESNVVYEDGLIWTGSATTNLITKPLEPLTWGRNNDTNYGFVSEEIIYNKLGQPGLKRVVNGSDYRGTLITIPWNYASMNVSKTYTVSLYARTDIPSGSRIQINLEARDGSGTRTDQSYYCYFNDTEWKKFIWTFTPSSNGSTTLLSYLKFYPSSTDGLTKTIEMTLPQVEDAVFENPFINGNRGSAMLQYNLNATIGLNWAGNWSIGYWKIPKGTSSTLTGYSIESLGCNSNSVGGGYIWWGKNSGGNSLSNSTPGAIDPNTYFGNLQFVILRKNGTTLTIDTYLPDGVKSTRTQTVSTAAANYYVTQYGYDLFLGGWDNVNVSNTYFRDLIVAKRYLSDTEVLNIYNNKMQHTNKNILKIQNSVYTGQVL